MARRVLLSFVAGFAATLLFHQPMLGLLVRFGITERAPYAMAPVPPFGVPAVISLAFWGGVWGIVMIPLLERFRGTGWYWVNATLFGAVFPSLVARFVVMPLKGGVPTCGSANLIIMALAVNAAWGIGTALIARALMRSPSTHSPRDRAPRS